MARKVARGSPSTGEEYGSSLLDMIGLQAAGQGWIFCSDFVIVTDLEFQAHLYWQVRAVFRRSIVAYLN